MPKSTKKQLEERIKVLEAENKSLKNTIEQLKKRVEAVDEFYKNCGYAVADAAKFIQQSISWNLK